MVYQNLKKLQRQWGMISRVLENTRAPVWARGMMYRAVSQLVLLYGSESWVVMGATLKVLEGFHHRASRLITGMAATRGAGRKWEYPLVVAALESVGLHPIME